jgi:hypothetical protein
MYTVRPEKKLSQHERTQNTTNSGKNLQLRTQIDTAPSQNGKISTAIRYYEIPTGRKEKPRPPTEETSGLLH